MCSKATNSLDEDEKGGDMKNHIIRAKVFLSCGQRTGFERKISNEIAIKLEELGFEPYIAIKQQSLSSLRENIYRQLETSDYYLFIDFAREELHDSDDDINPTNLENNKKCKYRGSLFAHQELAIASFLDLPILAFQEEGIKKLDGLMSALQVNSVSFKKDDQLCKFFISKINEKLESGEWATNWKGSISTICDKNFFVDTVDINTGKKIRVFHIGIRNNHRYKPLMNGSVLLERIINLDSGEEIPIETVETKWKGSSYPYVTIAPLTIRKFDAFFADEIIPNIRHFHILTDFGGYSIIYESSYSILATFRITSSNFPCLLSTIKIPSSSCAWDSSIELMSESYIMPSF